VICILIESGKILSSIPPIRMFWDLYAHQDRLWNKSRARDINQVAIWPKYSPEKEISCSRQPIRLLYDFMLTRIGCEINLVSERNQSVALGPDSSPWCDTFHYRATNQVALWSVFSLKVKKSCLRDHQSGCSLICMLIKPGCETNFLLEATNQAALWPVCSPGLVVK
jgi:hypothetical protein